MMQAGAVQATRSERRGRSSAKSWPGAHAAPFAVVGVVLLGVALRVIGVIASTGHGFDHWTMQVWTRALVEHPLTAFYGLELDVPKDHLPGDLMLFALIGRTITALAPERMAGNVPDPTVIKAIAIAADVANGLLLHGVVRRCATRRMALVAMAAYLLSPGVLYVSAIWGQWDAVSAAFAVGAVALAFSRGRYQMLAWPMLACACLIKPQYGLIASFLLLLSVREEGLRGAARSGVGGTVGLGLVQVIASRFDVGLPGVPARWSLLERMRAAAGEYDAVSLGAHNLWILPIGRGAPFSDQEALVAGISAQTLGMVLFATAAIIILGCAMRFDDARAGAVWGSTAMMFAMFLTLTRMHERYLFPVLPLIIVAAVVLPRLRANAVLVHVAYALNVHLAYTNGASAMGVLQSDAFWRLNALLLVGCFVHLMWAGLRVAIGSSRDITVSAIAPEPVCRTMALPSVRRLGGSGRSRSGGSDRRPGAWRPW
jgi:dolichyl-phosphate-mannose-protein mannosyltransferase